MLETRGGLERRTIPVDAPAGAPASFIFASPDAASAEKLLIVIHGSGEVRAGQWSRRVIVNDSLDKGSILPYVERFRAEGYGVLVMNTNRRTDPDEPGGRVVACSTSPIDHGRYVWRTFVQPAAARCIAIVAHSYGGVVASAILKDEHTLLRPERVRAVAFTDSVHSSRQLPGSLRPVPAPPAAPPGSPLDRPRR